MSEVVTPTTDVAVAAATDAVNVLIDKLGVNVSAQQVQTIALAIVDWLDGAARREALAAGQAAADEVTDEDSAEKSQMETP